MMIREQVSGLKARYFVYAGVVLMIVCSIIDSDHNILTAYEHGYADYNSLQRVIFPFHSSAEAFSALTALAPTTLALFAFAIVIAIMRRKA